jgi:DNA-binding NarL/FixJ family response regulator
MRILLVDDCDIVRCGIRSVLSSRPDLVICGEAADGVQAVEMAKQLLPDALLMDINMPRMDGLQAIRLIRTEAPAIKVIVVSQNDPEIGRRQAQGVGANEYVDKYELWRDLMPAVDRLLQKGVFHMLPLLYRHALIVAIAKAAQAQTIFVA